ncbi:DJ-1/PfpI family protein [Cocleimonas sp. KMM 6892]|jgi:transcriptional regulator GlxA family with amidase domain|uniref:DJ-1/PfpI family protein n=1 Tax=unclassified Cocleimonas TaxID=2639732 RepID=UPI002DBEDCB3|nr:MULTISPECIES: DJ-1/PfpI family protein [unclassified Cocleimonas]MEB8433046.1 DJ-1/PfpI family protein [Cocleimonas sp. KMM 6892]MEC4715973.1 DJ-1/PfpI family protein [Cocleimonas sp. KMM 6895]MEC4745434.1 DJ-1/PfpI family protein [Cocleimonas sp. KMM 6896]
MKIAILTFEGFNELDSFIALGILNRMKGEGWEVQITSPTDSVTSMNGVTIQAQQPLEYCDDSDVVLFGSGIYTREVAKDKAILERINLNTEKQLVGSQCSGALLMAKLKLLNNLPACTDLTTKPWVIEAGVEVLNQSFVAKNNIATAGGCMSSQYLATWVIAKLAGIDAAENALSYVSPVGEQQQFVEKSLSVIQPYL